MLVDHANWMVDKAKLMIQERIAETLANKPHLHSQLMEENRL